MYAVKDNRLPIIERMMELGCDLTTANKVRQTFMILPASLFCRCLRDGQQVTIVFMSSALSERYRSNKKQTGRIKKRKRKRAGARNNRRAAT